MFCATGEQLAACIELAEGDACTAERTGVCQSGACVPTACGNGVVDLDAVCDDGNETSGDRKVEECGDAIVDEGEACDDGGDGGPATSAHVTYPGRLAVDDLGNLYISDEPSPSRHHRRRS